VTASAEDRPRDEKVKMTVSERSLDGLGAVLEGWLAGQAGIPGRPTVTGVRVPDTGGLSSRSVLFEASWAGEGAGRCRRSLTRAGPGCRPGVPLRWGRHGVGRHERIK
jgi:hypothetical protein